MKSLRQKLEFEIDQDMTKSSLSMYNNCAEDKIKKHRTMYRLNVVTFSFDSVRKVNNGNETSLGDFIEIKLSEEQPVDELNGFLSKLGLLMDDAIKSPYFEM